MREFGKYSIMSTIGSGGMAEVFLAKSYGAEGLEKHLVIKRILPEFAERPKFVSMFIDEAKVAVSLNHPNIVQVYEFGKVGGDYYLAMEHVDGTDLGRVLSTLRRRRRSLSFGDAVYIGIEVAKALDYAHRKTDEYGRELSIVHRDVSPQNILITWDGSVKLVDFGIAKAVHTADERSGVVKGKMSYMAPEQAMGAEVDQRTDIFSLGAVLFEMVAGRAPYPRGKPEDVLTLVRNGIIPDIATLRDEVPPELRRIIMQAVAREPDDRYESARALQLELTRYLFTFGEIHDAGKLAEELADIRLLMEKRESAGAAPPSVVPTVPTSEDPSASTTGTIRETATLPRDRHTPSTAPSGPYSVPFFRERRETFIVAGEVLGLNELRAQLTDDRWRGILFDYIHLVQAIAFKSHCATDRVDERGFLLLAGVPVSSENDAETALRVARDLIEAVEAMSVNLPLPLQLSVGVGVGGLILERVRKNDEERYSWTADQPPWEIARHLAKSAMPGEVLVDGITHRRTRKVYEVTELREPELSDLGPIFRVDRPKTHRQRLLERRKSFTTLHGRDFELRLLRQTFREVRRKSTVRTVIFLGDPGVGKASIVEEFLSDLSADRVQVIRATCTPELRERPFAPVVAMLEDLFGLEPTADLRARKGQLEERLGQLIGDHYDAEERRYLLHAVALLFNVKYPNNVIETLEPERRRSRLFLSLRRILGAAASQGVALLVCNDVHWADQSSLEFVAAVVEERRKRAILVTLTARPNDELVESRWWRRLSESRDVIIHRVNDLSPHSARNLILDLLDEPMDPELVETIVERSGGNPLFIKEILESLHDDDLLTERDGLLTLEQGSGELEIPATVEGIVAGRIGSLPPGPKVVLMRCSLIGRELDEERLRAVFGEIPETDLEFLVERGFLKRVETPDGRLRYRFFKGLTRDVAAKALLDDERTEIHSKLAEHLIGKESDLAQLDLAAVARHLEAAEEPEDAGQYYLLAAANALDSSGLSEALSLVDRALALLEEGSEYRFTALDLKEKLLKDLGRTEERREVLTKLRAFVDSVGPRELETQLLIRTARFEFDMGRMEEAETLLLEALALADATGDTKARGAGLAQHSAVLRNTGRTPEAREVCERALELYKTFEDPEGAAMAWNQMGILDHQDGRLQEALNAYEKVVEQSRRVGLRSMEEVARINMGFCLVKMGEIERAVNTYRQVLHEILQLGHRRNEAALLANLGHALILLGDYGRAEHTLRRCIRLSRRSSDAMRTADGLLTLATAHLARGRLDDAEKAIKPGLKAALEAQHQYLICHGYLLSAELKLRRHQSGDVEGALADAERVLELAKDGPHLFALARGESIRAQCYARMDREAEAVAASERALARVEEGAVEDAEQVLYQHAQLMLRVGREGEARQAIGRAYARFKEKRTRIHNPETQRSFSDLRGNARIVELWEQLGGGGEE